MGFKLHFVNDGYFEFNGPNPHPISLLNQRSAVPEFIIHTGQIRYTCATCQKPFTDRGYFV